MAFPPRVGADGRIAWSEGEQNIRESIQIILQTEERERLNLPSFGAGLGRYLFEPNTVMTQTQIQDRITKAIEAWEPRVLLTDVAVIQDPLDVQSAVATIQYRLVATQIQESLSVNIQLGSA
jgi:phage baseplate assembly protein W